MLSCRRNNASRPRPLVPILSPSMMSKAWHAISNPADVSTPALLVYPERIEQNIRRMTAMCQPVDRLRPHVKTHKMAEVVHLQMAAGITKFKCATIAEAEFLGRLEAADVLLAYHLVGPNIARFGRLVAAYPQTRFSTIADASGAIRALAAELARAGLTTEVLIDLDIGQHRTGVAPTAATALYQLVAETKSLRPGGLHVYDGHIKDHDPAMRQSRADEAFVPVTALRGRLESQGMQVPRIVAGGTPTFAIHAARGDVECSPGTCILWDWGYASKFPDLKFQNAAVLMTRVISKPLPGRLCLDLGYKAVSPDNPDPRVVFFELPDAVTVIHNEEHLTIETALAERYSVGDVLYGVPYHICPTTALHREVVVVEEGQATARWLVAARDRQLEI